MVRGDKQEPWAAAVGTNLDHGLQEDGANSPPGHQSFQAHRFHLAAFDGTGGPAETLISLLASTAKAKRPLWISRERWPSLGQTARDDLSRVCLQ